MSLDPAQEAAGGVVFRELHGEVVDAAYQMVELSLAESAPLNLADAVLGATLAALLERGWLNVPDRRAS